VLALIAMLALAIREYERPRYTAFDHAVERWIEAHVPHQLAHVALDLANPWVDVVVLAVVVVAAAAARRFDIAALAALGPAAAALLTEKVMKPLVHRSAEHSTLAFPSGHETGFAATAAVLAVLLLSVSWPVAVRVAIALALLVLVVAAAGGLVAYRYHLATEAIGGICMALGCVALAALAVDWLARRNAGRAPISR
jgi:undecaprenyl-diphosphatase